MKKDSFIENHFDNKSGDNLLSTITPNWGQKNIDYHLSLLDVPKGTKSVLEYGCGVGRLLRELYDQGIKKCVGFDASQSMVNSSKGYIGERQIDIFKCSGEGKINLDPNELFDFTYSIITFQHIPNTGTVLKCIEEMYNHLREGGILTFQGLSHEMNKGALWTYHSHETILNKLENLGAKNIEIKEVGVWSIWRCKK